MKQRSRLWRVADEHQKISAAEHLIRAGIVSNISISMGFCREGPTKRISPVPIFPEPIYVAKGGLSSRDLNVTVITLVGCVVLSTTTAYYTLNVCVSCIVYVGFPRSKTIAIKYKEIETGPSRLGSNSEPQIYSIAPHQLYFIGGYIRSRFHRKNL